MAEVNDICFRLMCKEAGCGLTFTGMINPLNPKDIELADYPAIQLFCTSSKGIKEFIKKHENQAAMFDFNLGCPAKTARKLGFGSFLHENPKQIEEILKEMRNSTQKPISIKLRKSKNALKIAKLAEKYCDAVCIHPRTSSQGYSGEPDLKFALEIKKRIKLPVIYSGNVNPENIGDMLKKFDYVMIGRQAMGHPEIFAKLNSMINEKCQHQIINKKGANSDHYIRTECKNSSAEFSFKDYLSLAKKYKQPWKQIKLQAMLFSLGRENAKEIRLKLVNAKTLKEIKEIMVG